MKVSNGNRAVPHPTSEPFEAHSQEAKTLNVPGRVAWKSEDEPRTELAVGGSMPRSYSGSGFTG